MRRRGPSVLGTVVIAGAVSSTVQKSSAQQQQAQQTQQQMAEMQRQQDQLAQQQAMMAQQQHAPAPVAAAPSGGMSQDQINQLQQMAQLRDSGVLTQEEFDAKKKQILGL